MGANNGYFVILVANVLPVLCLVALKKIGRKPKKAGVVKKVKYFEGLFGRHK